MQHKGSGSPEGDVILSPVDLGNNTHNAQGQLITHEEKGEGTQKEALLSPTAKIKEKPPPSMKMFILVAWVTFLGEMSRGLVIPVLWPYLQLLEGTLQFLGVVSAAFSLSRFFAAPIFGWWSNKRSHKEVMLACLVLLTLGNAIYGLYPPPWLLLVSRAIIGLGAGTLGQSRGYVSQVTTNGKQRTKFMAYLTVSQFAGFAVTPGVSVLLSYLDFDLFGVERLDVDKYSSAGYLMAALSLVSIVVVYVMFIDPPPIEPEKVETAPYEMKRSIWEKTQRFVYSIPFEFKAALHHPEIFKLAVFSSLIFATRTAVAIVETASAEIAISFAWGPQTLSYSLCGLGVVGTVILIALPRISRKMGKNGEGILLCVGVFSLAFGMGLMVPWHSRVVDEYTFVVGLAFTWSLGSALCQTLIITFLSRILASDSQGAVMGALASLGSISRVIGGLWAGYALGSKGGPYLALGIPSGLMLLCLVGTIAIVLKSMRTTTNHS